MQWAVTGFAGLSERRQGTLAVLGAAILWSSGGLFIKAVSLDAVGITMWRSLFAAITILVLVRPPIAIPRGTRLVTFGIVAGYVGTLFMFVCATKLTTSANAIFLQYTAPLWVLLLAAVMLRERPTRFDLVTVAVAFGGMGLFFVGRLESSALGGNLLAAASGVTLALMFVLLRSPKCTPETRIQAMLLGNVVLVALGFAISVALGNWEAFELGPADLGGLLFLGVIQIGLAYILFGYGVARVSALEASLIGMLEPVLNPIWVFAALDERPGWWAVAGGTVIVGAAAVRTLRVSGGREPVPVLSPD
jgi:DME family drug/metabolite transporter